jgi:transcriptional regulator with XRE-family HTH domain
VSTGLLTLDEVLGGLYWGDNVVWDLAGGESQPFYAAITALDAFETKVLVSIEGAPDVSQLGDVAVIDAGPSSPLAQPIELLREIQRHCRTARRRLFLFDSLDAMVRAWGANSARGFFARCCPFLLEVGAIAYWTMSTGETPAAVRETVHAVTQCVLRVDERAVRVVKAEGREDGVTGTMLHWHFENDQPVLEPASVTERVAASLRALRRNRELNQHQLAELAGVTASAISQAERAERGLSLSTLARLTSALGVTIDDLIRGEDPDVYRIGRRVENPEHGPERAVTILGTETSDLRIDLVQLAAREEGKPMFSQKGSGIIAVAKGLVQVRVAGLTPAVRHG